MPAQDLAKWNIGVIDQKLLKSSSCRQMETEVLLKNGTSPRYALGLSIRNESGRRVLEHGGEVSGFCAENVIYPDERAAITVLTNLDATDAPADIARRIAPLLFPAQDAAEAKFLQLARRIFAELQQGKIDRSLFTANANSYFSEAALRDFAAGLSPLGEPLEFTQTTRSERGGMTLRAYQLRFPKRTLRITARIMPDGKFEQYQIAALD